ncbi:glycosyltransferase [Candidatus Woesearchaeota archaeon]|nr:glycosyltransferase [Candidatus Woesearchaeota archaeon]
MIWEILTIIITLVSSIGIYNYFTTTRLNKAVPKEQPFVSVLIPARNEEQNIAACLDSVFKQNYSNFEVVVCDDQSIDKTGEIIKSFQKLHNNLHCISGQPLPEGWTGKNWACQQLAKKAKGELFLYLDADVTLQPEALASAVALKERKKVSMLSCFPQQIMKSWGEWMLVPLVDWLLLSFVFLDLVYRTKSTRFSVAIGQFILISKEAYLKMGGHEALKTAVTEDVEMARRLKFQGERILVARSTGLVHCRMYTNFKDARKGLARFIFLGSKMRPSLFIISLVGLLALFILPFIMFFIHPYYLLLLIPLLLQRVLTSLISGQNILFNLLLLPVHYFFTFYISINSLYVVLGNKIEWKGRKINMKSLAAQALEKAYRLTEVYKSKSMQKYDELKQKIDRDWEKLNEWKPKINLSEWKNNINLKKIAKKYKK